MHPHDPQPRPPAPPQGYGWSPATGPTWPGLPPKRRPTALVVGAAVTVLVVIATVITVVVVTSGRSGTAAPNTGGPVPVAQSASSAKPPAPVTSGAPSSRRVVPSGDPGTDPVPTAVLPGDDGTDPGTDPTTGGEPGYDPGTGNGTDPGTDPGNGGTGNGTGNVPGGQPASGQQAILQSAMAWIDARNAGDGDRTLQLGCSDDVAAVQAGQPNPAAYAGYTAFRPTGQILPHSSGRAAYVVISSQDLRSGTTQPSRLPIILENGQWRMCYYPGQNANRIASGG